MNKYLLVDYQIVSGQNESESETAVLRGDIRMSNQRMLERFARDRLGVEPELTDAGNFQGPDQKLVVDESELVSEEEAEAEAEKHWVFVVNENVTVPASRHSYSGRVPGA